MDKQKKTQFYKSQLKKFVLDLMRDVSDNQETDSNLGKLLQISRNQESNFSKKVVEQFTVFNKDTKHFTPIRLG